MTRLDAARIRVTLPLNPGERITEIVHVKGRTYYNIVRADGTVTTVKV